MLEKGEKKGFVTKDYDHFVGAIGVIAVPLISDGLTFVVTAILYKITYKKIEKNLQLIEQKLLAPLRCVTCSLLLLS